LAAVEIQNVVKSYGKTEIIREVSVDVPDGAFAVLVGPSGCGKSTLLRMIAGLEDIDGGVIRIGGRAINDVEPKNRDIAMVFQNYALYPHLSISENMGFSLRLAKRPKAEIEQRVAEAARILGLSDYLDRYPRQLSGGQRQRVAMGRAIVRDPQVFLFDEPLSNLDAKLRVQMRSELKDIHARLKTTTIYVTHDQVEAMTMGDQIVVMRDGVVEQTGAPFEIYDRPRNTFVAAFIGSPSMNLLAGTLAEDGGSVTLAGGESIPLPQPLSRRGAVTVGVRPEHFLPASGAGITLTVGTVESTGSETIIDGQIGDDRATVLIRDRLVIARGDALPLRVAPEHVHLFDAETGERIEVPSHGQE
jgi:multiple sugar transport system ATP-binding protein